MAQPEPSPAVWLEPVRGGYPDPRIFLGLSGLDQIRAFLKGLAPPPPISHLTGLRPTEVGPGTCTFVMPSTPGLLSPPGWMQLGTLAMLADSSLGCAVQTALPPATPYTTAEMSLSAVRPVGAESGTLVARGRLIHAGRSLGLSEVTIEDGEGRVVAHGTSRCFLFPPVAPPPSDPPSLDPVPAPGYDSPDPHARPGEGEIVPQDVHDRLSGLQVLQAFLAGELPAPPIYHLTGLRPTEAGEGTATFAMPASEWLCSPLSKVQGGAVALVAETSLITAVQTTVPAATSYAPLDLKVNFLRPVSADGRDLVSRGRVIHRGRTIAIANSEVVDGEGKRVAVATGSSMILPGRPWRRPAVPEEESPVDR